MKIFSALRVDVEFAYYFCVVDKPTIAQFRILCAGSSILPTKRTLQPELVEALFKFYTHTHTNTNTTTRATSLFKIWLAADLAETFLLPPSQLRVAKWIQNSNYSAFQQENYCMNVQENTNLTDLVQKEQKLMKNPLEHLDLDI